MFKLYKMFISIYHIHQTRHSKCSAPINPLITTIPFYSHQPTFPLSPCPLFKNTSYNQSTTITNITHFHFTHAMRNKVKYEVILRHGPTTHLHLVLP